MRVTECADTVLRTLVFRMDSGLLCYPRQVRGGGSSGGGWLLSPAEAAVLVSPGARIARPRFVTEYTATVCYRLFLQYIAKTQIIIFLSVNLVPGAWCSTRAYGLLSALYLRDIPTLLFTCKLFVRNLLRTSEIHKGLLCYFCKQINTSDFCNGIT